MAINGHDYGRILNKDIEYPEIEDQPFAEIINNYDALGPLFLLNITNMNEWTVPIHIATYKNDTNLLYNLIYTDNVYVNEQVHTIIYNYDVFIFILFSLF